VDDVAEFTGKTVEDAISNAERDLGKTRDQFEYQVLSQGRSGIFGIGGEPARIAVTKPAPPQTEPSAPETPDDRLQPVEGATPPLAMETQTNVEPVAVISGETSASPSGAATAVETAPAEVTTRDAAALAGDAQAVLVDLLTKMGFQADVTIRNGDPLTLVVNGSNLGVLIGRRGDNLAALQFMVNLILSKNRRQWPRVVVDVENYRMRREESLRALADRIAYRVRRNQRAFTLEAMPASDRRVIHLALRDRSDVETYSIGEGPARRVVVAPKRVVRPAAGPSRH
jgi:spoIIIJ-associated protein